MNNFDIYQKKGFKELPALDLNPRLTDPAFYEPDDALVDAVNVAINLGKPLFVTGNPGTGKTQLAHHIAHFFNTEEGYKEPLLVFNTRSTSTARDLFYHYDSLGHFHYIQSQKGEYYLLKEGVGPKMDGVASPVVLSSEEIEARFIRYNALGIAIKENRRRVVLIDELDKAPRDLPNDILNVLEDMCFEVPEIDRVNERKFQADANQRPIVIITSNSEKAMPDPFLRRCVYYHLDDPDEGRLQHILMTKLQLPDGAAQRVTRHYDDVQIRLDKRRAGVAELIYWTYLLQKRGFDLVTFPETVIDAHQQLSKTEFHRLTSSYVVLIKNEHDFNKVQEEIKSLLTRS